MVNGVIRRIPKKTLAGSVPIAEQQRFNGVVAVVRRERLIEADERFPEGFVRQFPVSQTQKQARIELLAVSVHKLHECLFIFFFYSLQQFVVVHRFCLSEQCTYTKI